MQILRNLNNFMSESMKQDQIISQESTCQKCKYNSTVKFHKQEDERNFHHTCATRKRNKAACHCADVILNKTEEEKRHCDVCF